MILIWLNHTTYKTKHSKTVSFVEHCEMYHNSQVVVGSEKLVYPINIVRYMHRSFIPTFVASDVIWQYIMYTFGSGLFN